MTHLRPTPDFVSEESAEVTKSDLLRADLQAFFERFVHELSATETMIEDVETNLNARDERPERDVFMARLVEKTFHPSQIHSARLKRAIWDEMRSIRMLRRSRLTSISSTPWSEEEMSELVLLAVQRICQETLQYEDTLDDAAVRSHSRFQRRELRMLKKKIRDYMDFKKVESPEEFIDSLYGQVDVSRFDPLKDPWSDYKIDESWEAVVEAKTTLLSDVSSLHTVWIDFDGAKRPEGIMFSMYGSMLSEDIRRGVSRLGQQSAEDEYWIRHAGWWFLKTDVLIHVLTQVLRDNNLESEQKLTLEDVMDRLKRRRFDALLDLQKIRGQVRRRLDDRSLSVVMLSKRIRFAVRLDHKHIEALQDDQNPELTDHLKSVRSITQQIAEMKRLDPEILPQVMIANAEGAEDFVALYEFLSPCLGDTAVMVVPLFESRQTVADIETYLGSVWKLFHGNVEAFEEWCQEVFFAGSDLSKQVGQFSALVRVWNAALAIEAFNRQHGTDVRVKLGSGEAAFRQLGYLDPDAGLPLFQDESEIVELLGEEWSEAPLIPASGMHWMKKTFPWINSFTQQSRAREAAFMSLEPVRMKALFDELDQVHEARYQLSPAERPILAIPEVVKKAAALEEAFYTRVMGDEEEDLLKPAPSLKSAPAVYEFLSSWKPILRDRTLSRVLRERTTLEDLDRRVEAGIDSRAIATNTAASLVFPLYLMGKAAMLSAFVDKPEKLQELLGYVPVKDFLKEFRFYQLVVKDVVALLQEEGFQEFAELIANQIQTLEDLLPQLQEAFLKQLLSEERAAAVLALDLSDQERFFASLPPEYRTLLDPNFISPRANLYRQAHRQAQPDIRRALQYLAAGDRFLTAYEDSVEEIARHINETKTYVREQLFAELSDPIALAVAEESRLLSVLNASTRRRLAGMLHSSQLKSSQRSHPGESWDRVLSEVSFALGRLG